MKINLEAGIDQLVFGMGRKDVLAIYGLPDKQSFDDDGNELYVYNKQKWVLSFYEEEDFKLAYIFACHPELELFGQTFIGKKIKDVQNQLGSNLKNKLEFEDFGTFEHYFNDDNWFIFQVEFDEVVKFELGANIVNDEFVWKF